AQLRRALEELRKLELPEVIRGDDAAEMMLVPAGDFLMGSDISEPDALEHERPRHRVTVDAFYIDKYEVSNAQYERFIQADQYERPAAWSSEGWSWRQRVAVPPGIPQGASVMRGRLESLRQSALGAPEDDRELQEVLRQPVTSVSWYEADAYCRWAGKRLPAE